MSHSWERVLVLGGLDCCDPKFPDEISAHLNKANEIAGGNIKTVIHVVGKGASYAARLWAVNSGKRHAPMSVSLRTYKEVIDRGKPSLILTFPGMRMIDSCILGYAKGLPVIDVDSLHPEFEQEDVKTFHIGLQQSKSIGRRR